MLLRRPCSVCPGFPQTISTFYMQSHLLASFVLELGIWRIRVLLCPLAALNLQAVHYCLTTCVLPFPAFQGESGFHFT
jgi:hypothetical protein